jgi:selenocysteine lyase/cysteine desulfurase
MAGLLAAVEFLAALGMTRVEARIRYLRGMLEEGLRGISGVEIASPDPEELKAGMVAFSLEGIDSLALQRHLAQTARVRTRVIGEYDYGWMRLSTHVYNNPGEVERMLELLMEVRRNGL